MELKNCTFHKSWQQRAIEAEAKLAGLEAQQAVGIARMELTIGKDGLRYYQCFVDMRPDLVVAELNTGMELFTRPAPAVSLAELVPECFVEFHEIIKRRHHGRMPEEVQASFDKCAAILRNIEALNEAKS